MSAGARRGTMMSTMRCDYPDIQTFNDAEHDPEKLRMFKVSVLVTDAFMAAMKTDDDWTLCFNEAVYRNLPARALWDCIMPPPPRTLKQRRAAPIDIAYRKA